MVCILLRNTIDTDDGLMTSVVYLAAGGCHVTHRHWRVDDQTFHDELGNSCNDTIISLRSDVNIYFAVPLLRNLVLNRLLVQKLPAEQYAARPPCVGLYS